MEITVAEISKKINEVFTNIENGIDVESNEEFLNELMNKCIEMQQDNEEKLSATPNEEVVDIETENLKRQIGDLESKIAKIDKLAKFATRDTLSKRDEYVKELEGLKNKFDKKKIDANGKNEEIIRENEELSKLIDKIEKYLNLQATFDAVFNFDDAIVEPTKDNKGNTSTEEGFDNLRHDDDQLFDKKIIGDVLRFAITQNDGKITPSMVQRYCKFGYAKAAMLVDKLYEMGLVSDTFGTSSLRKVTIKLDQLDDFLKNYNNANTKNDNSKSATVTPKNITSKKFTDKEWEQLIIKGATFFHDYGSVSANVHLDKEFNLSKDETKELIDSLVDKGIIRFDDKHQSPYYEFVLPEEKYNDMFVNSESNVKDSVQTSSTEGIDDAYIDELSEMLKQSPLYNENNKVVIKKEDLQNAMDQFAPSSDIETIEPVSNGRQPINLDDLSVEEVQRIKMDAAQASVPTMDDIVFPTRKHNNDTSFVVDGIDFSNLRPNPRYDSFAHNSNDIQPSSIIMDDIVPMQQSDSITRYTPVANDNNRKKIRRKKKRKVLGSKMKEIAQKAIKSIGEYFFGDEEYRAEHKREKRQNMQDFFADEGYRDLIDSEEEQRMRRR